MITSFGISPFFSQSERSCRSGRIFLQLRLCRDQLVSGAFAGYADSTIPARMAKIVPLPQLDFDLANDTPNFVLIDDGLSGEHVHGVFCCGTSAALSCSGFCP
jgi:hypothetical protein